MRPLVVVERPERWTLTGGDVELVSAHEYLTDADKYSTRRVQVINLCSSYRYQRMGYYVSLLAEARGHRPLPSVSTMQDLKATEIVKIRSGDLEALIQKSLAPIASDFFELSCYFGRNLAKRHDRLAASLFSLFNVPLMRATFRRVGSVWLLKGIRVVGQRDIPDSHHECVVDAMERFVARRRDAKKPAWKPRYHLAILVDPEEDDPATDERTINKLIKVARRLGVQASTIQRSDYARLAEFDGLFIRATTNVEHYTYRFALRAAAEGLVVVDDPESILRCTNKVYLAELLARHGVRTPATMVLHRGNLAQAADTLGLPCVLKVPDSCFSQGVHKAKTADELMELGGAMLEDSELIIGQSFMPTEFDWRVGVLGGKALFVCRYFMAPKHWQIAKKVKGGRLYGRTETLAVDAAPKRVIDAAVRAASLIGNGLYGVDLKQVGREVVIIEVNDNPTFNAGDEDRVLGARFYEAIIEHFVDGMDRLRQLDARP